MRSASLNAAVAGVRSSARALTASIGVCAALAALAAHADGSFQVLHTFDVAAATTGASTTGSQPDTRPVVGPDGRIYGMTYTGGAYGNGVIYAYDRWTHHYTVLHTFGALDSQGVNEDGANPGVALTPGPNRTFYGMASFGGAAGNGTVFSITTEGKFRLLHSFSATNSSGFNEDGANPLRTIIIGEGGNLYGTTRTGGAHGLGVAWTMSRSGAFAVIHQYTSSEGHAASLVRGMDGYLYGCGVWPTVGKGTGVIYRMSPWGHDFQVLHRFAAADAQGRNTDGANCYEPLIESSAGVFYGTAYAGGPGGSGTVFRFALWPHSFKVLHAFGALACNASGSVCTNGDGANPYARLTPASDGYLYSTASYGGTGGNGVVFRIGYEGRFQLVHTFSATDSTTGANTDGANPDYGVIVDVAGNLFGMTDYGGAGSAAAGIGNGTLFEIDDALVDR